jgi:polyisoprenoid-binding protein YceI
LAPGEATRFRVLPQESSVEAEMRSRLHPVHASSRQLTGEVEGTFGEDGTTDLDRPHSARLAIPVASLLSGNRLQDMEMQRRLNVRQFPNISIDVTRVSRAGDGHFQADFRVEVMGKARDYQAPCELEVKDGRISVSGERSFDMRDFGVNPPRFLTMAMEPEVKVRIHMVASKE